MKIRSLFAVFFSLMMAQAAFAGATNCVEGASVPVSMSVVNTSFACTFYEENVYPFSLTPYVSDFGLYTADNYTNWPFPGFLVVTTDPGNVADTAAWSEVLTFVGDQIPDSSSPTGFDGSDEVTLSWLGGPAFPSLAAVENDGYLAFTPGSASFVNSSGLQSFTVLGAPPSATPEPSTLLLVFPAALGFLAFRRRRV